MIHCVYTETEKPVKPGLGQVQRPCFNLDWMTNQPYITREELAGNQCVCPPILHQYSVSFAHHMPVVFAVFLSFLFFPFPPPSHPLSIFSLSLQCGSLKAHCRQHLYFKDTFVSLLCIQMIRLAGRRMQLWRREGWRERREKRWRVGFWSQVSLRGDLYGPITNGGMHS